MSKNYNFILGTILFVLLTVSSCRKVDDELPTINVTQPLNNSSYAFDQYINIQGTATDETKLKTVKAELFTSTMESVGLTVEQEASNNSFDFSMGLLLDDRYLTTGQYILKISAIDRSGNEKSTFKNVSYTELPYALESIYVINTAGTSAFQLHKVFNTTTTYIRNFTGGFAGAVANLFHRQLIFAGNGFGKLSAYDPLTDQISWEVSPLQTLGSYFKFVYYNAADKLAFVASEDVKVKGYNKTGAIQSLVSPSGTLVPYYIFIQDEYMFLARKQALTSEFSSYYQTTNTLFQNMSVTGDVVSVIKKNDDELYLFTNNGSNSAMQIYTIANGTVWSPIAMPAGNVNAAVHNTTNEIFIAHESGILRYSYANNSLVTWVPGVNASKLYYDAVNSRLVAVVGTQIRFYDLMGNSAGIITHSAPIADVLMYYNK
jgi:hypothetical protein